MGTFITDPTTPTIFADKTRPASLTLPSGWTAENVTAASDLNALRDNLLDARVALRGLATNAKHNGAVGGGVTNDATAINATLTATGAVAYLPPDTYGVATGALTVRNASNTSIRGDDPRTTILKAISGTSTVLYTALTRENFVIENLTIDSNSIASVGILVYGIVAGGEVIIRNCIFRNFTSGTAITLNNGAAHVRIEDCVFYGGGSNAGTCISQSGAAHRVTVRNCRFYAPCNGHTIGTGSSSITDTEDIASFVEFIDNYVDGMYFLLPPLATTSPAKASGANVTYTATYGSAATTPAAVITNSGGGLSSLTPLTIAGTVIRVLPCIRSSTITACTESSLTDTGSSPGATDTFTGRPALETGAAAWGSKGLVLGDIIRTATKFTTVRSVKAGSNTVLNIDGWTDSTTYEPTSAPAAGTAYSLYKSFLGRYGSSTSTTMTMYTGLKDALGALAYTNGSGDWICQGVNYGPSAGTLYEVSKKGNYAGLHTSSSCEMFRVTGNTVKRCASDSISFFGHRALIANNLIEQGGDVGITLTAGGLDGHVLCLGNVIKHPGSLGIFMQGAMAGLITGNMIEGWNCINHSDVWTHTGISLVGCKSCKVQGNYLDGGGKLEARSGIAVYESGALVCSDNIVQGNVVKGFSVAGIYIAGASTTGTRLLDNQIQGWRTPQITCASVAAADTATVNGVVFTARAAVTVPATEWLQTGTDSQDATALATVINASTSLAIANRVTAVAVGAVVYLLRLGGGEVQFSTSNSTRLATNGTEIHLPRVTQVSCVSVAAADTVTITTKNGSVVFAARAAIVDATVDWLQTGSDSQDATALQNVVNASVDVAVAGLVSAKADGSNVVYFYAGEGVTITTSDATRLPTNTNAMVHRSLGVGGDYGRLHWVDIGITGTPEGFVTAGLGTMYIASTGDLYLKTSGTSSTGWTLK